MKDLPSSGEGVLFLLFHVAGDSKILFESIIIIGETILGLLFNEGGSLTASEWGAVGLGLLLSFCLQWIGFDIENGMHGLKLVRVQSWWLCSLVCHFPQTEPSCVATRRILGSSLDFLSHSLRLGSDCDGRRNLQCSSFLRGSDVLRFVTFLFMLLCDCAVGVHRRADPPASNYTLNCYNRTYIPYDPVLDPCVAGW